MVLVPFERYKRMASERSSDNLPYTLEDIGSSLFTLPESRQSGAGSDTGVTKKSDNTSFDAATSPTDVDNKKNKKTTRTNFQPLTPPQTLPPPPPPGAPAISPPLSPSSHDLDKEHVATENSWLNSWVPLQPLENGRVSGKRKRQQ